ncbi:MAG: phage tail assembly chaperone [Rhizobiales bacterium]|nr:phage tail assembly chaperone [Hyphomicrobiales bacterium]
MKANWWAVAFRIAVVELGIMPKDFWNLSLPEFNLLTQILPTNHQIDCPNRERLKALIKNHPDKIKAK